MQGQGCQINGSSEFFRARFITIIRHVGNTEKRRALQCYVTKHVEAHVTLKIGAKKLRRMELLFQVFEASEKEKNRPFINWREIDAKLALRYLAHLCRHRFEFERPHCAVVHSVFPRMCSGATSVHAQTF